MIFRLMLAGAVAVVGVALAACSGSDGADLLLDGSPFESDASGVVEAVSPETITIDGDELRLADEIVVFSASTLARVSLAGRDGQYVQVGRIDGEVVWVAAVGGVLPGTPPRVLFEGVAVSVDEGVVTFQSGLRVATDADVDLPLGDSVVVVIEPKRDVIVDRAS